MVDAPMMIQPVWSNSAEKSCKKIISRCSMQLFECALSTKVESLPRRNIMHFSGCLVENSV